MGTGFMYQGATGQLYEFMLIDVTNPKAFPWHGGVFALAKFTPEPCYFGESDNLYRVLITSREWAELEDKPNGPTLAYFMLEDDAAKRSAAVADLIEMYRPPLNQME